MTSHLAVLSTASALGAKELAEIKRFINKRHGAGWELIVKKDTSLIAGFKLNLAGLEYDRSLVGGLDQLSQALSSS